MLLLDLALCDDVENPSSPSELIADDGHICDDRSDCGQDTRPFIVPGLQNVGNGELTEAPDFPCNKKDDNDSQPTATASDEGGESMVVAEVGDAKNIPRSDPCGEQSPYKHRCRKRPPCNEEILFFLQSFDNPETEDEQYQEIQ